MPTTDSKDARARTWPVSLLNTATKVSDQFYHCSGASEASLSYSDEWLIWNWAADLWFWRLRLVPIRYLISQGLGLHLFGISDFWTLLYFHVHVICWKCFKSKQDILCFIGTLYIYIQGLKITLLSVLDNFVCETKG